MPKGRILWIGDAGSHGGFATVTHNIAERLVIEHGWDITVLAANYQGDHWDTPLKLYPASQKEPADVIGMSRFVEMVARVQPDAIMFVQDPKVVLNALTGNPWDREHLLWQGMMASGGLVYRPPILAYLAIDGDNSPRQWDQLLQRPGLTRIAMSNHGTTAMPEAEVIWHGVDHDVFYPRDKREAKAALGFDPDRFLVLRVDKNTWRKDYPSSWKALRPLLREHDDIDVHFHCRPTAKDGYDLNAVRFNDEDIRDRLTYTEALSVLPGGGFVGVGQEQMALLYNAADVFLSTSWGEGFGLTILEAMACGTPVIAQRCSAITEVVGDGGVLIEPAGRMYVPMGQEQSIPDVGRFTYWLERLYESRTKREALGAAAHQQSLRFQWPEAAKHFDAAITRAIEANQKLLAEAVPA